MITREQAIAAAEKRVLADGVMALEGRTTMAELDAGAWHVSFPLSDPGMRGGEPHVYVDGETGDVVRVVYTQ